MRLAGSIFGLAFVALLAINAVPAPTQGGGGGTGQGCPGGSVSCPADPVCTPNTPYLFLAYSNPQPPVTCVGQDFWVTLSISNGWFPRVPYSLTGEILYNPDVLSYSGWANIHGGPGTLLNLASPGHVSTFVYADIEGDSLVQVKFTRRNSSMTNASVWMQFLDGVVCYNGTGYEPCRDLGELWCEDGTYCSYTAP